MYNAYFIQLIGVLDNIPCGTEINAIINEKFETIEQDHTEYIIFNFI